METKEVVAAAVKACKPSTRYELAKRLKTDWNTVDQWAKGVREPRGKRLLQMLQIAQDAAKRGGTPLVIATVIIAALLTMAPPEVQAATVHVAAGPLCIMLNRLLVYIWVFNREKKTYATDPAMAV